jgi:hypothetical protein
MACHWLPARVNVATQRLVVAVLAVSLAACQSMRTPVLEPWHYTFTVDVRADPVVPDLFEPELVRGKGRGAASGAGKGVAGCFREAEAGGLGFLAFLFIAPACAVVGGAVGAGRAESAVNVDMRLIEAEQHLRTHATRDKLARLLARNLGTMAVYDRQLKQLRPEPHATDGSHGFAHLVLTIGDTGLAGKGIDPPLNLAMVMHVCVRNAQTGEMLLSQTLLVKGPARQLEKWAGQGEAGWTRDVDALADAGLKEISRFVRKASSADAVRPCPDPGQAQ